MKLLNIIVFIIIFIFFCILSNQTKNYENFSKKNINKKEIADENKEKKLVEQSTKEKFSIFVEEHIEEAYPRKEVFKEAPLKNKENDLKKKDLIFEKDFQIQKILDKENFENEEDFLNTAFPDLKEISKELYEELKNNLPLFAPAKYLSEKQRDKFSLLDAERIGEVEPLEYDYDSKKITYKEYKEKTTLLNSKYRIIKLNLFTKEQQVKLAKMLEEFFVKDVRSRKEYGLVPIFLPKYLPPDEIKRITDVIRSKTLIDGRLE